MPILVTFQYRLEALQTLVLLLKFLRDRIFEISTVLGFYEESIAARILNVSNLRCKSSKSENAILELPGALW